MSHEETSGQRTYTAASDTPSGAVGEFHGYLFGGGTNSHHHPCPSVSTDTVKSLQIHEEVKRLTAEANRVAAEATRLQAEVTRLAAENAELKEVVKRISAEKVIDEEAARKAKLIAGLLPKELVTGGGEKTMLICERVGCLALDFWVGMSESQKGELDITLEKVMKLVIDAPTWAQAGDAIRNELARVGIRLATRSEFCADQSEAWASAEDTSLPIAKRMDYALNTSSKFLGDKAYPHEILHFFKRLVELRRDGLDSGVAQPGI